MQQSFNAYFKLHRFKMEAGSDPKSVYACTALLRCIPGSNIIRPIRRTQKTALIINIFI